VAEGTIDTKTLRDMLGRGKRVTSLAVQDTGAEVLKVRRTDKG
jgi:hypothetical protein